MAKLPHHLSGVDRVGRPVTYGGGGGSDKPDKADRSRPPGFGAAKALAAAVAIRKAISKEQKAESRSETGATLEADCSGSECFAELYFEDGAVTATFARDGSSYDYPMSKSEAREWFDDDLGAYFNENVR